MAENDEPKAKKLKKATTALRALGFCGADDSVSPRFLSLISNAYPFVEFGVLFRPDKEGEPRYASKEWVEQLLKVAKGNSMMKLAAHLCGKRVDEILVGDDSFVSTLSGCFQRIQINATAVNGVDMSHLQEEAIDETIKNFVEIAAKHSEFEFIIQKNEETKPLWEGLLRLEKSKSTSADNIDCDGKLPSTNISMLVDESKGTGVQSSLPWPNPPDGYDIGYAGGIGPNNIETVLKDVMEAGNGRTVWIDMESSLRSTKNAKDVFDLDKCYKVIEATCAAGLHSHPAFLSS